MAGWISVVLWIPNLFPHLLSPSGSEIRHTYFRFCYFRDAELILNTAETERGFTTCLSASAATMRYRLKSIMQPTQKYSAPLLVGIIVLVLYLTCGYVTLAYSGKTGKDVLLPSQHGELYTLQECYTTENS